MGEAGRSGMTVDRRRRFLRMAGLLAFVTAGLLGFSALVSPATRHAAFVTLDPVFMLFVLFVGVSMLFASPTWLSRLGVAAIVSINGVLGLERPVEPQHLDYWLGDRACGPDLAVSAVLFALLVLSLVKSVRRTRSEVHI
jgi:hypothetical protein